MKIVMLNPFLAHCIRRRHTTLVSLREHGQDVELLFTSLKALDQLRHFLNDAVDEILSGREGTEWTNPSIEARRRARDEASDLLYDAGLLERPPFMRRPVIEPVVPGSRRQAQGAAEPGEEADRRAGR